MSGRPKNTRSMTRGLCFLLVCAAATGCTRLTDAQRAALEADAEAFESIVRSQASDSAAGSPGFLRVDARAGGDDAVLAGTTPPPRAIELSPSPDSTSALFKSIEDQRRSI